MALTIDGKEHIRVEQASERTGYDPDYVRRLLRKGKIEGIKQGTVWFVNAESLQTYKSKMDALGTRKFFQWRA